MHYVLLAHGLTDQETEGLEREGLEGEGSRSATWSCIIELLDYKRSWNTFTVFSQTGIFPVVFFTYN